MASARDQNHRLDLLIFVSEDSYRVLSSVADYSSNFPSFFYRVLQGYSVFSYIFINDFFYLKKKSVNQMLGTWTPFIMTIARGLHYFVSMHS